ncbi:hypothetical protein I79_025452 [Cricetulus griseus]|uniref:Uncharacterized protein n=1 Tax=Cricetulus griseus TaxID=10029 RepID=G3IND6_CRIGR|nr:hypothetical protein I79_025452 [Cricetulus griseus]
MDKMVRMDELEREGILDPKIELNNKNNACYSHAIDPCGCTSSKPHNSEVMLAVLTGGNWRLKASQEQMVSEGFLGFQAPLGKMAYLVFQAQRDTQGCLATLVFQEIEEGQAQMDNLEEREKLERRAGLAHGETWEREEPKARDDGARGPKGMGLKMFTALKLRVLGVITLRETKATLPVSMVHLVQRVNRVSLDTKDILEPLESKAFLEVKDIEDHQADLDSLVLLDHQGIQVIQGCLGRRAILEK